MAVALIATVCGGPDPTPTPQPTPTFTPTPTATPPPRLVELPLDDGSHAVNTEWWYYNGHLRTEVGDEFSFHYVIFQLDFPFLPANVAQVSMVDHQARRHMEDQRQGVAERPPSIPEGFSLDLDGWVMSGSNGSDRLSAEADGFSFNLLVREAKPPALHGGTGIIPFSAAGESYYYIPHAHGRHGDHRHRRRAR